MYLNILQGVKKKYSNSIHSDMDTFIDSTVANEEKEEMGDEEYKNALKVTTAIITGVEIAW